MWNFDSFASLLYNQTVLPNPQRVMFDKNESKLIQLSMYLLIYSCSVLILEGLQG